MEQAANHSHILKLKASYDILNGETGRGKRENRKKAKKSAISRKRENPF